MHCQHIDYIQSRLEIHRIMNYSASGPLFESDHPILNRSQPEDNINVSKIDEKLSNGLWAVQCQQVFSKEECQMIIEAAEARGFEKALIHEMDTF